jgi:hypothetical protein
VNVRRNFAPLSLTAILGLASQGHAQTGDGYVGVFADSAGTISCATVPPYTGAVLYVYAVTNGASASGLTGAEFRIEVSHPQGWSLNYMAPSAATTVLGNALDKEPGITNNKGVNLAFAECQVPVNNRVPLGAISVANYSGSPTNLTVKRHEKPKNPLFTCPLFILCDSPTFTSKCMSPAPAPPCSSLAPSKSRLASDDDPAVFNFVVNEDSAETVSPSAPFSDLVALERSELWVAGRRVGGPTVAVQFDGSGLRFNTEHVVNLPPAPTRTLSVETMQRVDLALRAKAGYTAGGYQEAIRELQSSPLVEKAVAVESDRLLLVVLRGWPAPMGISLDQAEAPNTQDSVRETAQWRAKNLISDIKSHITAAPNNGLLILVSGNGNLRFLGGVKRDLATAQIQHLLAGGSAESMPAGPLQAQDLFVQEIVAAR